MKRVWLIAIGLGESAACFDLSGLRFPYRGTTNDYLLTGGGIVALGLVSLTRLVRASALSGSRERRAVGIRAVVALSIYLAMIPLWMLVCSPWGGGGPTLPFSMIPVLSIALLALGSTLLIVALRQPAVRPAAIAASGGVLVLSLSVTIPWVASLLGLPNPWWNWTSLIAYLVTAGGLVLLAMAARLHAERLGAGGGAPTSLVRPQTFLLIGTPAPV